MHQLRVQHLRNQKNSRVQLQQLHSHETCYHVNQRLSQFKTNKNGAYAKPRTSKGRQETKKQEFKQTRNKTNKKTLLYALRVFELLIEILNSNDVFKKWKTQKELNNFPLASRCCALLRLFVFSSDPKRVQFW